MTSLKERDAANAGKRQTPPTVDETEIAHQHNHSRLDPRHNRRALELQRSRQLYYRERKGL